MFKCPACMSKNVEVKNNIVIKCTNCNYRHKVGLEDMPEFKTYKLKK